MITFALVIDAQLHTFRLPARLQNVEALLVQSYRDAGRSAPRGQDLANQALRTGWKNILDWLTAQMALVQSKMVQTHEIFLPYLLLEGYDFDHPLTYFELFEQSRVPMIEQRGHVSISED